MMRCLHFIPRVSALGALAGLLALALVTMAAGGDDPPRPEISRLNLSQQGGQLVISFHLKNAFERFARERVESGLTTRFEFEIRLVSHRRMWFDQKLKKLLEIEARYNAATMDYRVSYRLDNKLVDTRVVRDPAELERAMTEVHNLPVFGADSPLAQDPEAFVRVRGDLGSKTILWMIPASITTEWASVNKSRREP